MRSPALWAVVLALASQSPAADDAALKVKVAFAFHACQCDTPGLRCADPAADLRKAVAAAFLASAPAPRPEPAKPAPVKPAGRLGSYAEAVARVEAGQPVRFYVRVPVPADAGDRPHYHSDGFPATPAGVYDCSKEPGGSLTMRPVATPAANPLPAPAPVIDWRPALLPAYGLPGYGMPADCFGGT